MSEKIDLTLVIPFRNISNREIPLVKCVPASVKNGQISVLLVDDHSADNSSYILQTAFAGYSNVHILSSPYPQGKKHALRYGIEQAATSYVWLSDIDVLLPDFPFRDVPLQADLYILPLQMREQPGLLCRLQHIEYVAIQTLTMLAAGCHHPVMCSGANLLVRRECWLDSFPDLHLELPSGDDMFLLQAFKRKNLRIAYFPDSNSAAVVFPETTWKGLLRQRMRWAGKAPAYTDTDILVCGAWVVLSNLLALFPPLFLLKYIADVCLVCYGIRRYRFAQKAVLWYAFLLSLVYPWYVLCSLLGGLVRRNKW